MRFILGLFLLLLPLLSWSQDSRWIDLEWDTIPGAREYEIELFQMEEEKTLPRGKYKTDEPRWSHAVPPGRYFMRLRSIDKRGVPGEWSANTPLKVRMQNPLLLRPVALDKISDPLVSFEWGPVPGAATYQLVVRNKEKEILHNAVTPDLKNSVYLGELEEIEWATFALEKDEAPKPISELPDNQFKRFFRVGGLLEAPKISLKLNKKVSFSWENVRSAQVYEVDYLPPPDSGEKNRRFKLKLSPLAFAATKLREGITTLTIKATAPGYQDSPKSVAKISRDGSHVEIEDIIQGKYQEDFKSVPTETFLRNELLFGVSLAQFSYESENFATDTRLSQKNLSGLGFTFEWNKRPTLNSLNRKMEASLLHLSSGIDSGFATRFAYSWNKDKKMNKNRLSYGAGLSYLGLPAFMGNRFDNKIEVDASSSLGPELHLGYYNPLNQKWSLESELVLAYHPLFISSRSGGGEPFPWIKVMGRANRYFTDKQAFFMQLDYQSWTQSWSDDSSSLSGITINFGIKTGF